LFHLFALLEVMMLKYLRFFVILGGTLALASAAFASSQEAAILFVTNQKRAKAHLKPLKYNPKLAAVAREQSALMVSANTLSHEVHGKDLPCRVKKAHYSYRCIAENIATASGGMSADALVNMWMSSKGHRHNILNGRFDEIGIGIKVAPNGTVYYTQVFGKKQR
jgi:uncharacterized protein YkwD